MRESHREIRRVVIHRDHPVVHLLVDQPPLHHALLLHVPQRIALLLHVQQLAQIKIAAAKIYQLVVDLATVVVQPEMSAQVVKSVIHAGFVLRRKIVISLVSVLESLNQIFQMRLLEKSWKKAFEQNY
jgi:hypothetical protein